MAASAAFAAGRPKPVGGAKAGGRGRAVGGKPTSGGQKATGKPVAKPASAAAAAAAGATAATAGGKSAFSTAAAATKLTDDLLIRQRDEISELRGKLASLSVAGQMSAAQSEQYLATSSAHSERASELQARLAHAQAELRTCATERDLLRDRCAAYGAHRSLSRSRSVAQVRSSACALSLIHI